MTTIRTAEAFLVLIWLPFTIVWLFGLVDIPSPVFGALAGLGLAAVVVLKIGETAAIPILRAWIATRLMRTAGRLIDAAGWLLRE